MSSAISTLAELNALESKAKPSEQSLPIELLDAFSDIRDVRGQSCGDAGGVFLGFTNTNRSQRVRVYYETSSNVNGPWQGNKLIGPGQTEWIICSAFRYGGGVQYFQIRKTGANYE